MKRRKRITNYYIDDLSGIHITNIIQGKSNMIVVLTVNKTSNYSPPILNRFLNLKYMPDVRLVYKEYKVDFTYYIFDVNFTLENEIDTNDDIVKYLSEHIFNLTIEEDT